MSEPKVPSPYRVLNVPRALDDGHSITHSVDHVRVYSSSQIKSFLDQCADHLQEWRGVDSNFCAEELRKLKAQFI